MERPGTPGQFGKRRARSNALRRRIRRAVRKLWALKVLTCFVIDLNVCSGSEKLQILCTSLLFTLQLG